MRDRRVHGERGVSRGCGGALLLGVPRLGAVGLEPGSGVLPEEGVAGHGEGSHQNHVLLEVHLPVSILIQVLHDLLHGPRVLLGLGGGGRTTEVEPRGWQPTGTPRVSPSAAPTSRKQPSSLCSSSFSSFLLSLYLSPSLPE